MNHTLSLPLTGPGTLFVWDDGAYREATRREVCESAAAYTDPIVGKTIRSSEDTVDFLRSKMAHLEHEVFAAVYLDNRHRVTEYTELFRGTIDGTSVYPREVIKGALTHNAAAVIFAHNHPSGVAEPSEADERITRRLKAALEMVDIRLLDHVVIGGSAHVSLASRGML